MLARQSGRERGAKFFGAFADGLRKSGPRNGRLPRRRRIGEECVNGFHAAFARHGCKFIADTLWQGIERKCFGGLTAHGLFTRCHDARETHPDGGGGDAQGGGDLRGGVGWRLIFQGFLCGERSFNRAMVSWINSAWTQVRWLRPFVRTHPCRLCRAARSLAPSECSGKLPRPHKKTRSRRRLKGGLAPGARECSARPGANPTREKAKGTCSGNRLGRSRLSGCRHGPAPFARTP